MNYIILDLEWNSAYSREHGRFINEIIEIGAVKLDEKLCEVDSFRATVRSRLTKKLSGRFKTLTSISNEEMLSGVPFEKGLEFYSNWVSPDDITMTWSNTDLYVLLENCRLFSKYDRIPCIGLYIDLQRFVQGEMSRGGVDFGGQQVSLANAAGMLGIDTESMDLHRAQSDSRLCCIILNKIYDKGRLHALCEDTAAADYYDRLTYKAYIVSDINSPLVDRSLLKFKCEACDRPARRTDNWIFKSRAFRAPFVCDNCGNKFMGRVTFKKLYDKVTVKRSCGPMPVPKETAAEDGAPKTGEKAEIKS